MSNESEGKVLSLSDIPEGEKPEDVKPLLFVNYARERSVRRAGGYIYGWWSPSFAGACEMTFTGAIPEGALVSLRQLNRCPGGDMIVVAEHY